MSSFDAPPIAVIGFSSAASPLEPAWPSTHRALLPVAGKSLILHLIEQLAAGGLRHIRIAGSIQQCAVKQRLGDGSEWGITIRYSDLHGTELRVQTLLEHGHCLHLCGDNLHVGNFATLQASGRPVAADPAAHSQRPGYWQLTSSGAHSDSIAAATGMPYAGDPMLTVQSYHEANIEAASFGCNSLRVPGLAMQPGVAVAWDCNLAPDLHLGGGIAIGKHCRIDRRVRLEAQCVLGNGVVIARDTQLESVVVLPNTFIGAGTRLRDAVVTPLGIFDLDGQFFPISDRSVIGRARSNQEHRTGIPSEQLSVLEKDTRSRRRRRAA